MYVQYRRHHTAYTYIDNYLPTYRIHCTVCSTLINCAPTHLCTYTPVHLHTCAPTPLRTYTPTFNKELNFTYTYIHQHRYRYNSTAYTCTHTYILLLYSTQLQYCTCILLNKDINQYTHIQVLYHTGKLPFIFPSLQQSLTASGPLAHLQNICCTIETHWPVPL